MVNREKSYERLNNKNIKWIDMFYKMVIEWKVRSFIQILKDYSNLKGNAITNEMNCYFAAELVPDDEDYFGDTGVAFYFDYPAVDENCIIVLTNKEFYDILVDKCKDYLKIASEHKDEIEALLITIKQKLNV